MSEMLLEKRLIACASLHDNTLSLYRWKGEIVREKEIVWLAKTVEEKVPQAIALIEARHSYDIPCVLAYAAEEGSTEFMQWMVAQTSD